MRYDNGENQTSFLSGALRQHLGQEGCRGFYGVSNLKLKKTRTSARPVWQASSAAGQRDVPEQEWLRQPHPSQEAERPRYA